MRNTKATKAKKVVTDLPERKTINELADYCEANNLQLDQFTTIVVHNGYTEEEFSDWLSNRELDDKLDATAVKKEPINDMAVGSDRGRPKYFPEVAIDPATKGSKGEITFIDRRDK